MSDVDWNRYNLPAIWSLISDVDVCDGADRVLAWDGLASTVRDQHKRLLAAAESLAAVWPPSKNDSAFYFMQAVNGLAGSMEETMSKAEDTKAALNGVVDAFGTAQSKIRDLASGRDAVSHDWKPRFVDHAEDKYDEHAQAAMRDAEAAIGDHGSKIQSPSLYRLTVAGFDDNRQNVPSGSGGAGSGGSASGTGPPAVEARPNPVEVPSDPSSMIPPPAGLGSTSPGLAGSDSNGVGVGSDPGSSGPVLSGLPTTPAGGAGGVPPFSGVGPTPGVPGGPIGLGPNGGGPIGGGPVVPGVLPIGGSGFGPGGLGALGGPSAKGTGGGTRQRLSTRKAMPSGAVIGEESERGTGARSTAGGAMPMGAGAGGRGQGRSEEHLDGEADQRWATQEGVAPVIEPDDKPVRHDPGPGVIGFNK
jgi:hypothetical protein